MAAFVRPVIRDRRVMVHKELLGVSTTRLVKPLDRLPEDLVGSLRPNNRDDVSDGFEQKSRPFETARVGCVATSADIGTIRIQTKKELIHGEAHILDSR